uniref:Bm7056, isoform d n=1 Tax=Brugia malayi TaxID=6279 RepID=A0A0J9XPX7_BRUMA|nr:Bm7056, isoform d [Brugia malayi]
MGGHLRYNYDFFTSYCCSFEFGRYHYITFLSVTR